ncbi:AraC family transcriptional regulator [Mucilaginibacter terrae]|uniref:AraC-like DNA-binding protein n=1 Tax=Mucilaginibacter terrae TaxID=1955052 RepID=A0ABU3H0R8_9SPHI|nr:AraC family transcriptional regulator [Mucilaginibacter terrae]MDT3405617.1 AraC-like DNA-binding protein [Mucilaginibacter terrae]
MPVHLLGQKPHILYSCYTYRSGEGEQFIPEHIFSYILSGTQQMHVGGKNYDFKEGDFRFFRKNQLCRFVKQPPPGGEFKSLSVYMDKHILQEISAELDIHPDKTYTGDAAVLLKPNPLLQGYANSLSPYMDAEQNISPALSRHKVKECVMLLLQTNAALKDALFDFSEPGKIDLEAYMNANYRYNVDISRFAYLTGRSLATFKRDFTRVFNSTPNKWLQQKRLTDAYYLIKEKGHRVSDVYMEVGFKDFSHFSFAFKKAFGMAPSAIIN